MIEKGLYSRLTADGALIALIGTKVFPHRGSQSQVLPYVTYTRIFAERMHHLAGPSGLARPTLQLDVWSLTYAECKAIADRIRVLLDGLSWIAAGYTVQYSRMTNEREEKEPIDVASDTVVYRSSMDFEIWFNET
jgi:hypothetical protein